MRPTNFSKSEYFLILFQAATYMVTVERTLATFVFRRFFLLSVDSWYLVAGQGMLYERNHFEAEVYLAYSWMIPSCLIQGTFLKFGNELM